MKTHFVHNFKKEQSFFVEHKGEVLEIILHQPNGRDQFPTSFYGSKNFSFSLVKPLENETQGDEK